eukprot:4316792-Amphidinium_carterae.1
MGHLEQFLRLAFEWKRDGLPGGCVVICRSGRHRSVLVSEILSWVLHEWHVSYELKHLCRLEWPCDQL